MKWKIEASTSNGSDDEASDYKVTVVTPIIEESGIDKIFIKAAYNCWSEGDREAEGTTYSDHFLKDYAFFVLTKVAVQLQG